MTGAGGLWRRAAPLLWAVLLPVCGGEPCERGGSEQVLAPGEALALGGERLTFVRVVGDSRCPEGAVCIRAGEIVIEVARSQGDSLTLRPGEGVAVGECRLVLLRVDPPRRIGQEIEPSRYRAVFRGDGPPE